MSVEPHHDRVRAVGGHDGRVASATAQRLEAVTGVRPARNTWSSRSAMACNVGVAAASSSSQPTDSAGSGSRRRSRRPRTAPPGRRTAHGSRSWRGRCGPLRGRRSGSVRCDGARRCRRPWMGWTGGSAGWATSLLGQGRWPGGWHWAGVPETLGVGDVVPQSPVCGQNARFGSVLSPSIRLSVCWMTWTIG